MNTKNISFILSGFLIALLAISFASAYSISLSSSSLSIGSNMVTLNLSSSATDALTQEIKLSNITFSDGNKHSLTYVPNTYSTTLTAGSNQIINYTASGNTTLLNFGSYTITPTIAVSDNSTQGNKSATLTFSKSSFCKSGDMSDTNLSIETFEVDSNRGSSYDTDWRPLDKITVKVKVKNTGSENVRNVYVELGLFNLDKGNKIVTDIFNDSSDAKISLGTIEDSKTKTATFDLKVPLDFDFDAGSNYALVAKTYTDKTKELQCVSTSDEYESITIDRESEVSKYIAFDNLYLNPDVATCGDIISFSTDVYNVGDNDQTDLTVYLYNKELGLNLKKAFSDGLDSGYPESANFEFQVPKTAKDGVYNLELSADYTDGTSAKKIISLKLANCASSQTGNAGLSSISVTPLESEAKAGSDIVVKTTIKNLGTQTNTFVISASDYSSWATLKSITPDRTLTLGPGISQTIQLTFNVNKDISGTKTFTIESTTGTQSDTKEIDVPITKSTGLWNSLSDSISNNSLIWIIGVINVILIILIIIIAIRLLSR